MDFALSLLLKYVGQHYSTRFAYKLFPSLQRMKYLLLFVLTITVIKSPAQNGADAIIGQWESTENNLIVEVYKQHHDFKAKVLWFYDEDDTRTPIEERLDVKNPNKKLRSRKILGADILSGLVYDPKKKRWEKGRIYDSSSGRTWDATVSLINPNILSVRGFYLVRWLGKTLTFKKVKPAETSQ